MKFGTMQNVLNEPAERVFVVAAELGFDGVELNWADRNDAADGGPLAKSRRAAIKTAADKAGMQISSICADFLNPTNLAHPEAAKRNFAKAAISQGIELAADLGAPLMLIPFFGPNVYSPAGKERLANDLRAIGEEAAIRHVKIAIEHSMSGADAARLLSHVNSPWVGDYWDMANGLCFSYSPPQDLEALKGHLFQVHAKEYHFTDGQHGTPDKPRYDPINRKPFGQGDVPVKEIFAVLKGIGYDGWIVLETGAFGDHKKSAKAALELLKGFATAS